MGLFYVLAKNGNQYRDKEYEGSPARYKRIRVGDLAFASSGDGFISALWRLREIEQFGKNYIGKFDEVFSLITPLETEKFIALDLFKVTSGLITVGNRANTFPELSVYDAQEFKNVTANASAFETYADNPESYRKIVLVEPNAAASHKDIQIKKDGNGYSILNSNEPFMNEFVSKFKPQRYRELCNSLRANPKGHPKKRKTKDWLESNGTNGTIGIVQLWHFFCTKTEYGDSDDSNDEVVFSISKETDDEALLSYKNLIIYGVPGCGKSYKLRTVYLPAFKPERIIRTTFHPEYSNSDFVGQLRPVKRKELDYEVFPGPFLKALELALKSKENVALVIEEINRGNASAIFGDLFQLLDRNASGESEYDIENEVISSYLEMRGIRLQKIKIPSNLYLFATMNTSDQNVFKLDTAFKRRWEFERLTNEDTEKDVVDFPVFTVNKKDVYWLEFIKAINAKIVENDEISGDRQIGNFFYQDTGINLKRFANKVLEYLYNDVCKYGGKEDIFKTEKYKSFDDIYNAFVRGDNVFRDELFETNPAPASPASGAGTTVAPTATNSANVSATADASVKGNDEQ